MTAAAAAREKDRKRVFKRLVLLAAATNLRPNKFMLLA